MQFVQSLATMAYLLLVATAHAAPAKQSPQQFLEAIYQTYVGKDSKGLGLAKPAEIRRYLEPALAAAMIKDSAAAAKRGDVGTLDGDPFIDGQDWEITDVKVSASETGAKANGSVSFNNFKEAQTVTLDLVKLSAGWRIADIHNKSGSLRKLFKVK